LIHVRINVYEIQMFVTKISFTKICKNLLTSVQNLQEEGQNEIFQAFMEKFWVLIPILYFLARFPSRLWERCEGKQVEYVFEELNMEYKDADCKEEAISRVVRFILRFNRLDRSRFYIGRYIFWNFVNVVSSVISVVVIDKFIDGHFLALGFHVSGIKKVFPLKGLCSPHCTASLGFDDEVVASCHLNINHFAQVAFPVLW